MQFGTVEAVPSPSAMTLKILLCVIHVFSGFTLSVYQFKNFPNLSNGFVANVMLVHSSYVILVAMCDSVHNHAIYEKR